MNRMMGMGEDFDFLDQAFQPILEFTFDSRSGLQQRKIQRANGDVAQRRRHIALRDSHGETFDHGRLADSRLAGKDRIVLAASHQNVDDLANFKIAPQHGIDLAGLGLLGEIDR